MPSVEYKRSPCARFVQNNAGIDFGSDGKRDTRFQITLDHARDNVGRRALRGEDHVNTRSTGFLRKILDAIFHIFLRVLHHRRHLIGDNHDLGQFFFPFRKIRVVFVDIDHVRSRTALLLEQAISAVHFPYCPVETLNHFINIRDNFIDHQMRQFIAVAGTYDEHLIFFSPDEVNLRKGTKVRITGGDFEGYEGVFVKVKGARDRRVVISLQGVIAMAMATLSPDLIEVIEEPKKR